MKNGILTVDKAGRVVLPKAVRDELRLHAGARVAVRVSGGRLELSPLDQQPALVQRDGWWVHGGTAESPDDLAQAVGRQRDDRVHRLRR